MTLLLSPSLRADGHCACAQEQLRGFEATLRSEGSTGGTIFGEGVREVEQGEVNGDGAS